MNHTNQNPLIDMINGMGNPFANGSNKPVASGIVRVLVRTNYGTKHYYPANRVAELFLAIQGGKVLSQHSLKTLKQHGYEIEYRYDDEEL